MLWTEKYRPNRIREIQGQEHFVLDASTWIEEKNMPNVLIYGNAGNGKTTAGICLAKDILEDAYSSNFLEINASDDRRLETVRTYIKDFARTKTIGSEFKICLLDEMDGMTTDSQNALKRLMERYSNNIRFIITCNDRFKIIHPLQSRCANYRFSPLNNNTMESVLLGILRKEGFESKFSNDDLRQFIYSLNGDIRRAITELQACVKSNKTLSKQINESLNDYNKILIQITERKMNEALESIHNLIYGGLSMSEICNNLHDCVISASGLDTNNKFKYLKIIGEAEWRSKTMTPKVLASWLVGQLN
ncbi:putative sliding-clamp-loader subunit [Poseidoniales virus YSH_150918]|uniref:Sliding-clamp-loader subunit n=1 Tax=Poseidoniales virus YSH_150918 TaxID=3071324 RepID=A0A976YFA8_9CAUD|nr:putative sliding-clamp-loader subunit [Yangshan Harbor Poseidoniales virus]UVF62529.1 putative sliding-clamp-loader subunit [Poseidoniales virus YSH_150918]